MFIEILVFGGQGGIDEMFGKRREGDGGAALAFVNLIDDPPLPVQEPGGGGGGVAGEVHGVGQTPKHIQQTTNNQ